MRRISDATMRGVTLGVAQANSTAAPIAAVVCVGLGLWPLAIIDAVATVFGLLLWRRLGWALRPYRRMSEPWPPKGSAERAAMLDAIRNDPDCPRIYATRCNDPDHCDRPFHYSATRPQR